MNDTILLAMALAEIATIGEKDRLKALDRLQAGIRTMSDCIMEFTSPEEHDSIMYYIYQTCKEENTRTERKTYASMLKHCIYGNDYDD